MQWLFVMSLAFGAAWFNPWQFDWAALSSDWRAFASWMLRLTGPPEHSWTAWYKNTTERQYEQASGKLRLWRIVRLSRLLIPFYVISMRSPGVRKDPTSYLIVCAALAGVAIVACQALHTAEVALTWSGQTLSQGLKALLARHRRRYGDSEDGASDAAYSGASSGGASAGGGGGNGHGAAPTGPAPPISFSQALFRSRSGPWVIARSAVVVGTMVAVAVFQPTPAPVHRIEGIIGYSFLLWWAARVVGIITLHPLTAGARAVNGTFDALTGCGLLLVQFLGCVLLPCGRAVSNHVGTAPTSLLGSILPPRSVTSYTIVPKPRTLTALQIHTRLLFGKRYGDATAAISGCRDALDIVTQRPAGGVAAPSAAAKPVDAAAIQLSAVEDSKVRGMAGATRGPVRPDTAPVYRVGVRNYRLKRLDQLVPSKALASSSAGAGSAAAAADGSAGSAAAGAAASKPLFELNVNMDAGGPSAALAAPASDSPFGTFAIPGLSEAPDANAAAGTAAPAYAAAASANALGLQLPSLGGDLSVAAAAPPPAIRHKTAASIIREHTRAKPPPPSEATRSAIPSRAGRGGKDGDGDGSKQGKGKRGNGDDGADSPAGSADSPFDSKGRPKRRRKLTGIDKAPGDDSPAGGGGGDGDGGGGGGFASIRARFEKK